MPKLTPTNLEKLRWSAQSWSDLMSDNMRLLNDTLLKVESMFDVDLTALADGDVLQWNQTASMFENVPHGDVWPTTTTTTSTTVTTTTQSSTTTTNTLTTTTVTTTTGPPTTTTTSTTVTTTTQTTVTTTTTLPYEVIAGEFTEVDGGTDITLYEYSAAFDTMQRNRVSYVYKDYGAAYFKDFIIEWEARFSGTSGDLGHVGILALANTVGTFEDITVANSGVVVSIERDDAEAPNAMGVFLNDFVADNVDGAQLTASPSTPIYYFRLKRQGTTMYLDIYSDANRTTKLDTLSITCSTNEYRYLHIIANRESAVSGTVTSTGVSQYISIVGVDVSTTTTSTTTTTTTTTTVTSTTTTTTSPYEDFTLWSETDPGGYMTITDKHQIDYNACPRNAASYIQKDYGAAHFKDFVIQMRYNPDSFGVPSFAGQLALSNVGGTIQDMVDADEGLVLSVWRDANQRLYIHDFTTDESDYVIIGTGTRWVELERNGTTLTAKYYSDAFITLVDTLTINCSGKAFRYMSVPNRETSTGTAPYDGKVNNFEIISYTEGTTTTSTTSTTTTTVTQTTTTTTVPLGEGDLLIHSNHTDGSQNFEDSSPSAYTLTDVGDVHHSNVQKKFGGSSIEFDGTGDRIGTSGTPIGTTEDTFTVDTWIYPTASNPASDRGLVIGDSDPGAATSYWSFGLDDNDKLVLRWWDGASKTAVSTNAVDLDEWTHIAVTVDNGTIRLFINGVSETIVGTTTLTNRTGTNSYLTIGQSNNQNFTGFLDEIRVDAGVASWTSNFTPPTAPYGPDFPTTTSTTSTTSTTVTTTTVTQTTTTTTLPYEDFTEWTEYDPSSLIAVTKHAINTGNVNRTYDGYVQEDYGYTWKNFKVRFRVRVPSDALNTGWGAILFSDGGGTVQDASDADNGLMVYINRGSVGRRLYLIDYETDNQDYDGISANTYYYIEFERNGTTATVKIYSDSDFTTLVDTLTVTCSGSAFKFIGSAARDHTDGAAAYYDVENLEVISYTEGTTTTTSTTTSTTTTTVTQTTTTTTLPPTTTTTSTTVTTTTSTTVTTTTTAPPAPSEVTAKSVIFDIADNHGDAGYIGLRSVDFYYKGQKILLTADVDYDAYSTTFNSPSRNPKYAFDTSLAKIGGALNKSWMSLNTNVTDQRLIIVFNDAQTIDGIVINNEHATDSVGGGQSDRGINNVVVTTSTDEITSTTYEGAITNGTVIFDGAFTQHVALNEEDAEIIFSYPYEDFEDFTETDTEGDLTISVPMSEWANARRDSTTRLIYDFGANYFDDFQILFDFEVTAHDVSANILLIGLSNIADQTYEEIRASNVGLTIQLSRSGSGNLEVGLKDQANDNSDDYNTGATTIGQTWAKLQRIGTAVKLNLYSDEARTTLVDTLTITDSGTSFRYLNVTTGRDTATVPDAETDGKLRELWINDDFEATTTTTTSSTTSTTSTTTTTTAYNPPSEITAKSVIFDIADNYGDGNYTEFRSADFYYQGEKIELTQDVDYVAYESSKYNTSRWAKFAFDTSLSKTGGANNTAWMSASGGSRLNQRIIIVFNSAQTFDGMVINNGHATNTVGGGESDRGIQNVVVTASTDTITSTTYEDTITNATLIFDGAFRRHRAQNYEDPEGIYGYAYVWDISNKNANIDLTNSSRTAKASSQSTSKNVNADFRINSGKWYWEILANNIVVSGEADSYGVSDQDADMTTSLRTGLNESWAIIEGATPAKYHDGASGGAYGLNLADDDVLMFAVDMDNNRIWLGKNGTWYNSGDPANGTNYMYEDATMAADITCTLTPYRSNTEYTSRFRGNQQKYTPPSGFSTLDGSDRVTTTTTTTTTTTVTTTTVTTTTVQPITWDSSNVGPDQVLSNGNLTVTGGAAVDWETVVGTLGRDSGKYYFEVAIVLVEPDYYPCVGIGEADVDNEGHLGAPADGWCVMRLTSGYGRYYNNNGYFNVTGMDFTNGDVVMVAVNLDDSKIWIGKNGTWYGASGDSPDPGTETDPAYSNLSAAMLYPAASTYESTNELTAKFKDSDLTYTPPSGYQAWAGDGEATVTTTTTSTTTTTTTTV